MSRNLKVLFYDLETAPGVTYRWPHQEYVPANMNIRDTSMLTWSAKWRGAGKIYSRAVEIENPLDDVEITSNLAEMIDEAEIIVAHNIARFDLPTFNTRLLMNGLEPMSPVRTIDTLVWAQREFRFSHNNLDYLAQYFGLGGKLKTDFDLWRGIVERKDPAYLRRMLRYNRRDVVLLEGVFERMLPYVRNVPRMIDPDYDLEIACPYCGSHDLQRRGFARTNASTWQVWQCNICKKYPRTKASEKKRPGLLPVSPAR